MDKVRKQKILPFEEGESIFDAGEIRGSIGEMNRKYVVKSLKIRRWVEDERRARDWRKQEEREKGGTVAMEGTFQDKCDNLSFSILWDTVRWPPTGRDTVWKCPCWIPWGAAERTWNGNRSPVRCIAGMEETGLMANELNGLRNYVKERVCIPWYTETYGRKLILKRCCWYALWIFYKLDLLW